ncbi:MobF family relaxase [Methylohalobius crimeensis]|uniref:MobF family relaxase n=1 Tax=Methylohalobius crimeensis TaxID=244365 RepID=UPI0003B79331|nr:MobF family relaxase [Methylohalobius crimeensis]
MICFRLMISIKHLKSEGGAQRVAQYAEHKKNKAGNKVGYYSDGGGAPSFWRGAAAKSMGLSGSVNRSDLVRVLEGKPFGLDKTRNRKLGVDLTFSAPKSVSILAFHPDTSPEAKQEIFNLHDDAVRAGLDYIQQEVVVARRGKGSRIQEKTGNLLAGVYRHEDARSVDGVVDPQIHSHSILINATQRADGKWGAVELDFGRHAARMHLADHIYKSTLASGLRSLGYDLRQTENGFEIASITDQQIEQFSGRRRQIDEGMKEEFGVNRDESTANQRAAANLASRGGKGQLAGGVQVQEWKQRILDAGVVVRRSSSSTKPISSKKAAAEAIRQAVEHLSERSSVFSHDDLIKEAFEFAGPGGVDYENLLRAIDGNDDLIHAGDDQYTTWQAIEIETEILARALTGREKALALTDSLGAEEFIAQRENEQGYEYSAGQRQAVQAALTIPDRYIGIVGAAGAGKSTALAGVTQAFQQDGYEVVGLAPSSSATSELKGVGTNDTRTLASYLTRSKQAGQHQKQKRPRLVLLDEAGMVSARDMRRLMRAVDQSGDRVILIGDPRQLSSVEAGSPFDQLLKSNSIKHAKIDEIQRQHDPRLREIAQRFAKGDAAGAVKRARPYMKEVKINSPAPGEKVTVTERQAAIARAAADDWLARAPEDRERTLIVSGTNRVRQEINNRIREALKESGEIDGGGISVNALDRFDMTRARRLNLNSWRPEMLLKIREGREDILYKVKEVDSAAGLLEIEATGGDGKSKKIPVSKVGEARVYSRREINLAAGDRIVFRENDKEKGIKNGMGGKVDRIEDGSAIVKISGEEKEIKIDAGSHIAIDYGWATTIHSSQGQTFDNVIVAGEGNRVATAQSAYVATSRERHSLTIYTDDSDKLSQRWKTWAERQTALQSSSGDSNLKEKFEFKKLVNSIYKKIEKQILESETIPKAIKKIKSDNRIGL